MRAQGHEAAQLLCEMQRDAVKGVVALAKGTGTPMGLASQTVHVSALAPDQVPAVESLLRLEQSIGLPVAWKRITATVLSPATLRSAWNARRCWNRWHICMPWLPRHRKGAAPFLPIPR